MDGADVAFIVERFAIVVEVVIAVLAKVVVHNSNIGNGSCKI